MRFANVWDTQYFKIAFYYYPVPNFKFFCDDFL